MNSKQERHSRYRTISSMAQLRLERDKIRWQTQRAEEDIARDYEQICEMLSFPNILKAIFSKVENIRSMISGIRSGYDSISAIFRKKGNDAQK